MDGFKKYIESYGELADILGATVGGPSPIQAVQDLVDAPKFTSLPKLLKFIDLIVGASKMVGMVPPTYKNSLDILYYLSRILRHPKKFIYWKEFAKKVAEVGKLTAANPLLLFPAVTPILKNLEPNKQAVVITALKVLSSIYFYLASAADKVGEKDKLGEIFKHLKPFLPHTKKDSHST